MDERVGPREVVGVRHARLVVVAVAGRSVRVPLGAVQQDPFGQLAVFLLAAQQAREAQRGGTVQRGDRVHPIAPPERLPLLAAPFHIVRVLLRLGGGRRIFQELFAAGDQLLKLAPHRPLGQLAQLRQLFRTDEQPRVRLGNPGQQFIPRRHGHRRRTLRDRKGPRPAPVGQVAILVPSAIPPPVLSGRQLAGRTIDVEFDPCSLVCNRIESRSGSALEFPPHRTVLWPPRETGWVGFRHRRIGRAVSPFPVGGRSFVQLPVCCHRSR